MGREEGYVPTRTTRNKKTTQMVVEDKEAHEFEEYAP